MKKPSKEVLKQIESAIDKLDEIHNTFWNLLDKNTLEWASKNYHKNKTALKVNRLQLKLHDMYTDYKLWECH
jgi:hypothetical protein